MEEAVLMAPWHITARPPRTIACTRAAPLLVLLPSESLATVAMLLGVAPHEC